MYNRDATSRSTRRGAIGYPDDRDLHAVRQLCLLLIVTAKARACPSKKGVPFIERRAPAEQPAVSSARATELPEPPHPPAGDAARHGPPGLDRDLRPHRGALPGLARNSNDTATRPEAFRRVACRGEGGLRGVVCAVAWRSRFARTCSRGTSMCTVGQATSKAPRGRLTLTSSRSLCPCRSISTALRPTFPGRTQRGRRNAQSITTVRCRPSTDQHATPCQRDRHRRARAHGARTSGRASIQPPGARSAVTRRSRCRSTGGQPVGELWS